ncbi:MAG: metal ABC transporter permease [Christensenellaceae bacterium]|jgi:zinc transport system permease protein|nr:metal ABC transporter permease [Christensenellaceae bacterium]
MSILEYFKFPFIQYAFIVGILIALTAALIGVPLVLKRYSYLGDGLSHVAFTGMSIATVANMTNNLLIVMPVTIITAVALLLPKRNAKINVDSLIAIVSVGTLALGYFIINTFSNSANVSGDVCASLFGSTSILTLQPFDVWLSIVISVAVILSFVFLYNKIFATTFDADFAIATGVRSRTYELVIAILIAVVVSISMRLVGSLLTSALIIFPALSSMRIFKNFKSVVICSAILGVISTAAGLLAAIIFETPVGATIVLIDILVFIIFCLLGLSYKKRVG